MPPARRVDLPSLSLPGLLLRRRLGLGGMEIDGGNQRKDCDEKTKRNAKDHGMLLWKRRCMGKQAFINMRRRHCRRNRSQKSNAPASSRHVNTRQEYLPRRHQGTKEEGIQEARNHNQRVVQSPPGFFCSSSKLYFLVPWSLCGDHSNRDVAIVIHLLPFSASLRLCVSASRR